VVLATQEEEEEDLVYVIHIRHIMDISLSDLGFQFRDINISYGEFF